jgi:hypothetical protein
MLQLFQKGTDVGRAVAATKLLAETDAADPVKVGTVLVGLNGAAVGSPVSAPRAGSTSFPICDTLGICVPGPSNGIILLSVELKLASAMPITEVVTSYTTYVDHGNLSLKTITSPGQLVIHQVRIAARSSYL